MKAIRIEEEEELDVLFLTCVRWYRTVLVTPWFTIPLGMWHVEPLTP